MRGGGIDIARDTEIHQEESAIGTRGHGVFQNFSRQNGFLGGNGRDDDVWNRKSGVPVAPLDDAATELSGEGLRFVAGAIHHMKMSDAAVAERGNDLFADRAGAEDRSEEHTSELQSRQYLVCRLLLEKKKRR